MDEEISKWILEFTLHHPPDPKIDRIIHGFLPSLPLKSGDNRLKKTLILHRIEFEVSRTLISEKLLDLLELMQELHDQDGNSCSKSMKSAYCAVAVDCTARFLDKGYEFNANNPKYIGAVNRVWKDRVCKIDRLVSEELSRKMEEIVAALWDSEACRKLMRLNTRDLALERVRVYVEEEWKNLGPSFLEWLAGKVGKEWEGLCKGGAHGETQKGWAALEQKHMSSKRGKGTKSLYVDEETDAITEKAVKIPAPKVDRVESSHQLAFKKGQAPIEQKHITVKCKHGKGAKVWFADEEADVITEIPVKIPTCEVHTGSVAMESSPVEMEQQASKKCRAPVGQKHFKVKSKHDEGATILYVDEETDVITEKAVKIAAPEVDRGSVAMESSSMEMEWQASKKGRAPVGQKHIKVKSERDERGNILYVDEETDAITEKAVKIPAPEVDGGSVAMEASPMEIERQVLEKDRALVEQKHMKLKGKHDEGANILYVYEETDVITVQAVKIPAPEVDGGSVAVESSPIEMEQQVSKKGRAPVEQKHITVKSKRGEGAKILHVDEETDVITEKAVKILAPEVQRVLAAIESGPMEMERQVSKKGRARVEQKHITVDSKCGKGAKILQVDEETDVIMEKAVKIPAPEVDRVLVGIESSPMEMEQQVSEKVDLRDAQIAQTLPNVMDNNINCESLVENQPHPRMEAVPEVERVQETLKSNAIESHAAVRDPLPDALQTETGAEIHASPRANTGETRKHRAVLYKRSPIMVRRKRGTGAKISVVDEEDDMLMEESLKTPPPEVDRVPASIESSPIDLSNAQAAQTSPSAMETPVENHCSTNKSDVLPLRDNETHASSPRICINKIDMGFDARPGTSHPSPIACVDSEKENPEMRQNPTRHGKPEANASTVNNLAGGSSPKRPRLPSQKVNMPPSLFPLKRGENRNTVTTKRRTSKKWKPEEENALRKGVRKYGEGNWKLIWLAYEYVFHVEGRTEVDLKDKWRNLTKGKQRN